MPKVIGRTERRTQRTWNSAKHLLDEAMKTMDLEQIQGVERFDPRLLETWRPPVFQDIAIKIDREPSIQNVNMLMTVPETVIYTDTSSKQSALCVAAVMLDRHSDMQRIWQAGVGSAKHWSVHAAELIAIYHGVEMGQSEDTERPFKDPAQDRTFTIVSDCKSALQAVANLSNRPGQHIVHYVLDLTMTLRENSDFKSASNEYLATAGTQPTKSLPNSPKVVGLEEGHQFYLNLLHNLMLTFAQTSLGNASFSAR